MHSDPCFGLLDMCSAVVLDFHRSVALCWTLWMGYWALGMDGSRWEPKWRGTRSDVSRPDMPTNYRSGANSSAGVCFVSGYLAFYGFLVNICRSWYSFSTPYWYQDHLSFCILWWQAFHIYVSFYKEWEIILHFWEKFTHVVILLPVATRRSQLTPSTDSYQWLEDRQSLGPIVNARGFVSVQQNRTFLPIFQRSYVDEPIASSSPAPTASPSTFPGQGQRLGGW
jgi:hypothetical protein